MDNSQDIALRAQLVDRRQRLESAIAEFKETASVEQLLKEVDSALERMDKGTYGICEFCHDPVERERLIADPLVRYCLSHLTAEQQRALEQDLDLASQIQRQLLPEQNLSLMGWEVYYHYEAAGPVSGDYCDLVIPESDGENLFFVLGDASGKGVAASMLMTHLHAIFRSLIAAGLPVQELVERANRVFCESRMAPYFATLVCGRAGISGEIEICNAGHCPPLWVRGGEVTCVDATGLPLGIFRSAEYSVKELQLATDDGVFLYTDGLSEARDRTHAEYGEARLSKLVSDRHALPSQALVRACLEDLANFVSGAPKTDDLTLMAIRRVG